MPEKLNGLIKFVAVAGMAVDMVAGEVAGGDLLGRYVTLELAVETPVNPFDELAVAEVDEVTFDIEDDGEGGLSVIESGLADVLGEALLAEEDAFAEAAGVGVSDEAAVPPVGADIEEEVVNDAITEGRSDDLADDWIVDDESDAAARAVMAADDTIAQGDDIFHVVEFETMLVDGFAFALAGDFVGAPKLLEQEIAKRWAAHDFLSLVLALR